MNDAPSLDEYRTLLAKAMAVAPSLDQSLMLWAAAAAQAPSAEQVALESLGNPALLEACRQRMEAPDPKFQGLLVERALSLGTEAGATLQQLLQLGLLSGQASCRVSRVGGGGNEMCGPLQCLIHSGLGRRWIEPLLDGGLVPEQADLDHALAGAVSRASGTRSTIEPHHLDVISRLVSAGAQSDHAMRGNMVPVHLQVLSAGFAWERVDRRLLEALLKPVTGAAWPRANDHGHSPMSQWVRGGGSLDSALALGDGARIPAETLVGLVRAIVPRELIAGDGNTSLSDLEGGVEQIDLAQVGALGLLAVQPLFRKPPHDSDTFHKRWTPIAGAIAGWAQDPIQARSLLNQAGETLGGWLDQQSQAFADDAEQARVQADLAANALFMGLQLEARTDKPETTRPGRIARL